jgi:hypothetical protein
VKHVITAIVLVTFPIWILPVGVLGFLWTMFRELHDILWGDGATREHPEHWVE